MRGSQIQLQGPDFQTGSTPPRGVGKIPNFQKMNYGWVGGHTCSAVLVPLGIEGVEAAESLHGKPMGPANGGHKNFKTEYKTPPKLTKSWSGHQM